MHPMLASLFSGLHDSGVRWTLLRTPRDLRFPPGDVDLLVHSSDIATFDTAARAAGFRPVPGWDRWPDLLYLGFDAVAARFVVLEATDRVSFGRHAEFVLDAADGVLDRAVALNGLIVPRADDAFWLLLLHCLLDKGDVPPHYRSRLVAGSAEATTGSPIGTLVDERADSDPAVTAAGLLAGAASGDWAGLEAVAERLRSRWARAVPWTRRLAGPPLRWLRRGRRLALLRRRRGVSVALLGTNGAGKSTLSEGISDVFPLPVSTVYMGLWKDADAAAGPVRQLAAAAARPFRAFGKFAVAEVLRARGHLVVFDRYVYDARRPPAPPFVAAKRIYFWALSRMCGSPDLVVLLDLPGAVAFGRKGEDGVEETEAERREFLAVGHDLGADVVDATQDVTRVRADVLSLVWEVYRRRWERGAHPLPLPAPTPLDHGGPPALAPEATDLAS